MPNLNLKIDPNDTRLSDILAQLELGQQGSVMAKEQPMETGSSLLDTILEMITPTSPMSAMNFGGGVMSEALRRHQASAAPKWIEELMSHPNFGKFRDKLQQEVERTLGPLFKVYRGIGPNDLKALNETGYLPPRPTSFSVDPQIAKGFAFGKTSGVFKSKFASDTNTIGLGDQVIPGWDPKMVEALATPESVIARPSWNPQNTFGKEKELLLDPKSLVNYVLQELGTPRLE